MTELLSRVPCAYVAYEVSSFIGLYKEGSYPVLCEKNVNGSLKKSRHVALWRILGDASTHGIKAIYLPKYAGEFLQHCAALNQESLTSLFTNILDLLGGCGSGRGRWCCAGWSSHWGQSDGCLAMSGHSPTGHHWTTPTSSQNHLTSTATAGEPGVPPWLPPTLI